jgi:serine/threonine-protein kinase HipA
VTSEHSLYVGLAFDPTADVTPAGVLKLAQRGAVMSGEFAYGRQYLRRSDAEPFNPVHLPLQEAVFKLPERRLRDGGAMPLTFRDALPDSWGRKVLEARYGRGLSDVQALLLTNDDRVGAMVFGASLPVEPAQSDATLFKLDDLANAARELEMGQEPAAGGLKLLLQGGTLGGVRPKATFIHEGRRHIAKFPARADDHDVAVLEAATLALARACGIKVPGFFILPVPTGHALVLQRFDREGRIDEERRLHYLSASALLDVAYEDNTGGSYVELAQVLRRISAQPEADLHELYRRMVFNLVAGNSDDHVKNHGVLLAGNGRYRLAPAFDLVMQLNGNTGYQLLAVLPGKAESSLGLARQAAAQFGLSEIQAEAIITHVRETVRRCSDTLLTEYGADAELMRQVSAFLQKQEARIAAA